MNIRRVALITFPSLMALANLCGNVALMGVFIACGDSLIPCLPSKNELVLSSVFAFPVSVLPISLGYLGFVTNAILWAVGAYFLLRLVLGKAKAA
jgi:hypothetical protein